MSQAANAHVEGRPRQTLRETAHLLFDARTRRRLGIAMVGTTLVSLAETGAVVLVAPLLQVMMGEPLDEGIPAVISGFFGDPGRAALTGILVSIVVGGFILKDLATMAFRWWMLGFMFRQQIDTAGRLFDHYLRSPYSFHLRTSPPALMKTLGVSLGMVYGQAVLGTMSAATEIISMSAILLALFAVMPLPTLVAAAYFGAAAFLFVRIVQPRARAANVAIMEASERGYRATFHALEGIKEIKLRDAYADFVHEYNAANSISIRWGRITSYIGEIPKYVLEIIFMIGVGIVVLVASGTSSDGSLLGTVGLMAAASFRILPSITRITSSITAVRAGAPALEEVTRELRAAEARPATVPAALAPPMQFNRELRLDGLAFRYGPDAPEVLTGVDLTIPAGASLALVGGSGAGKSTLVDLVLGLHTPTGGRILVDGVDVADRLSSWQRDLAMVPQDVYLLDATLRQNIAFTLDESTINDALIGEVVAKAQLSELVDSLPEGLQTQFGARGIRLSGGQKQRIGIARALYRQPRLLVLDEATSALDNETEHRITQTIEGLRGEMTLIIVAHRLSTVRRADALAFMKEGNIEAYGTFDEVREASPDFARLVALGTLEPSDAPTPPPVDAPGD